VCTTTPCQLCGANEVARACREALGVGYGETTPDGLFTLQEVECLGACVNAPVVWVDDDYYEDVDAGSMRRILEAFRRGETPPAGSQTGRHKSAPAGGMTTLKDRAGA
jgi:NADH:ubiquinone oxidoreductase subunit E